MKQPTADQCNDNADLYLLDGNRRAFACWYPQMGGYTSKAIVEPGADEDDCFEAYIWHDGEFPFSEDEGEPAHIHHCVIDQFIEFGNLVKAKTLATPVLGE